MGNCDFCESIPFDKLPSEEEDALPHQLSLDALEASSESCSICKLILWAAGCSLAPSCGMIGFHPNVKYPSGRKIMTEVTESNYDKFGFMRGLENGAAITDTSNAKPDLREPMCLKLRSYLPERANIRPWLFGNWYRSPFEDRSPRLVGLGVRLGTGPSIEDAEGNNEKKVRINGTYLRIRTDDNADLATLVPGRLRTDYQGSDIALQRVEKWVENCCKGHDCNKYHSCSNSTSSPSVPTRLLEVSGRGETVRVVELGERREDYVALSHCWGLSHRLTTTKENYHSHRDGIPLSQLPTTFRQAVLVTRRLDVQYLWIDSLCIIQDDFLDWEHEASKMGNVYAHAFLTISALSSTDDSSGCFTGGNADGKNPKAVSLETPFISCDSWSTGRRAIPLAAPLIGGFNGEAVQCRVYNPLFGIRGDRKSRVYMTPEWMPPSLRDDPSLYLVGQFGRKVDPFEHEPLNKRCWALQERLLSPRTLHYGTAEMYWECQYCVLAEDGAMLERTFLTIPKVLESVSAKGDDKPHRDAWHMLIEEFSARNLTRDQDKLPALSGLANLIAAKTGDNYVAGLWRSKIVEDLFWTIETIEPSHHCDDPGHDASFRATKSSVRRPTQYRAPSWSWAALDGKIEYWPLNFAGIQARCVEVQISPAGKDKFGRVQSGWISLEGPLYFLYRAEWERERYRKVFQFTLLVELRSGIGMELLGKGHANFDEEPYFPSFALMLDQENALILKANGLRTFTRIGTVRMITLVNAASTADPDPQGQNESKELTYAVEDSQAAEIATGLPQVVTIF